MRFPALATAVVAAATITVASPLSLTSYTTDIAGDVVTDKGVTYLLQPLNEIKTFDAKVDNGEYPHPVKYVVKNGYSCIFYLESTRGVGSPIGQFNGPTRGSFQDKVECYKCWRTGSLTDVPTIRSRADASPISNRAIPCGFVRTAAGDILSLKETSRNRTRLQGFSINGQYYTPVSFHVSEICSCRFYSTSNGRGPQLISEQHGESNGSFDNKPAIKYECWMGV